MAYLVRFDTKKQLAGALDRGDKVRVLSDSPNVSGGYLDDIVKSEKLITVTNRNREFFAIVHKDNKNKWRVE